MGEAPTGPRRGAGPRRDPRDPAVEPGERSRDDTWPLEPAAVPGALGTRSIPVIERYRLGAELGRGGMGRVMEAFDVQLGRTVAFKEALHSDDAMLARRFAREVQLTARLEHPSIVPLYDAGTTADGRPFYVMRRVSGRPLDQLMARATGLGERLTLLPALLAAIDAVGHAHRRGVIHRDLKPANILVGELGETIVIDWGLAKLIGEDDGDAAAAMLSAADSLRTQIGAVFGTPGFMSPEQARGEELDPRGDVYALGATLHQLLSGAPPHAGTSASAMIENTGRREVASVAAIAPGAPPELAAIVGKALAFDPAGRYPDAGALGEDVRRFLAGQLVAAHRYTRRQRLGRFVRRHRAALSVAALAVASLAVVAGFGLHRIVAERDAANLARVAAAEDRSAALRARDEVQHRADQLIVMQARGLLDKNPTHAAAVLKELPADSARIGDARAVAQAAVVRGVAWTMATSNELTVVADLSPDATLLLQVSRDGQVRVWDLDHRRLVVARSYPKYTRAWWAGKQVLVVPENAAPELFDPLVGSLAGALAGAGAAQPIALRPISSAVAATTGERAALIDDRGQVHLLDVATRAATPVWPGHHATAIAIAADASWLAVADHTTVAVLDPSGRELARHPGAPARVFGSRFGQIGYATDDKLVFCTLHPRPVWTELDLKPLLPSRPVDYLFVGHQLNIFMSSGQVLAWTGDRLRERFKLEGLSYGLLEADRELLVAPGIDGKLHVANRLVRGELHLPVPLTNLKVLARPGSPRIIALGRGVIAGFDLADSLPEELDLPTGTSATFVDDDTLLLWRMGGGPSQWLDLATRRATPFDYEPQGATEIVGIDPSDGRVLLRETAQDESLVVLRKGSPEQRRFARGPSAWGRLLPHGAIVYGVGDGRIFDDAGGAPRELVKLDGIANNAVGLGGSRFAAASTTGELVRGDLATGALDRIRLPPGPPGSVPFVAAERSGRVLVARDNRLLIWDRDLTEIAVLDKRILRIEPSDGGVLLELVDHSLVRTALVAGLPVRSLLGASTQSPMVSSDGRVVVGMSLNGQVVVLEAATLGVWDLPVYFAEFPLMTIAPTGRRFIQSGFQQVALWTLPQAPPALRAWLDERTNAATDDDHTLVWPR